MAYQSMDFESNNNIELVQQFSHNLVTILSNLLQKRSFWYALILCNSFDPEY